MNAFDDKEKEAVTWVVEHAFRLGATLGTWLDTDLPFCNRAARAASKAMMPSFVDEIELRLRDVARDKEDKCRLCGKPEDKTNS